VPASCKTGLWTVVRHLGPQIQTLMALPKFTTHIRKLSHASHESPFKYHSLLMPLSEHASLASAPSTDTALPHSILGRIVSFLFLLIKPAAYRAILMMRLSHRHTQMRRAVSKFY